MNRDENAKFDTEELEANEFAGNLVMPAARIEQKLQGRVQPRVDSKTSSCLP